MSVWSGARERIGKTAMAVTEAVGEESARAVRRNAVVAGRELRSDLRDAALPLAAAAAGSMLAANGMSLLARGAAGLLQLRMPRWAATLTVGTGALLAGVSLTGLAWRRLSRVFLSRTRASLGRDLGQSIR